MKTTTTTSPVVTGRFKMLERSEDKIVSNNPSLRNISVLERDNPVYKWTTSRFVNYSFMKKPMNEPRDVRQRKECK